MASINYSSGIVIPSTWLNDVNTVAYTYFGNGANLNSPTRLTIANLNLTGGGNSFIASTIANFASFLTFVIDSAGTPKTFLAGADQSAGGSTFSGSFTNHPYDLRVNNAQIVRVKSTGVDVTGILTASTSVVTPLVGTDGATDLNLKTNGTTRWVVQQGTGNLLPLVDNTYQLGAGSNRILSVFTPIIDSGTTGSLSLRTNNGTTGFGVRHTNSAVNFLSTQSNTTGNPPSLGPVDSSDADVNMTLYSKGTGAISLFTNTGGNLQFQVLHTASASRNITVTGSNGGNPTIGVTAGSLTITPSVSILGVGPSSIGGTAVTGTALSISGTSPVANNPTGVGVNLSLQTDGSSTVSSFIMDFASSTITLAAASFTLNETGSLRIAPPTYSIGSGAVVGNATTLEITAAPASGTTKRALWVKAGLVSFDGGQIQFPATQVASSDANTLDDYEEGTWTPSLGGNTVYVVNSGTYTKIGRLVYITARLQINTIGTGSTTLISGLPFTVQNAAGAEPAFAVSNQTLSATNVVSTSGSAAVNTTAIFILSRTAAQASETTNAIFGNGTTLTVSGCYQV